MIDFTLSAPELARSLIGTELLVDDEAGVRGGIIIETEAYTKEDPASHSYRGITKRNEAMFMDPGTIYIYQIYGMHYCLNIVCGDYDGQAVLIRALRPTRGQSIMKRFRKQKSTLTNGPANLVQALGIVPELNRVHLTQSTIRLVPRKPEGKIISTPRIGITKGQDVPWRFLLVENP